MNDLDKLVKLRMSRAKGSSKAADTLQNNIQKKLDRLKELQCSICEGTAECVDCGGSGSCQSCSGDGSCPDCC